MGAAAGVNDSCFLCPQNEKCHLLVENETQKLKHLDEQHNQLLKDWRDHLKPRKKVTSSNYHDELIKEDQITVKNTFNSW